MGSKDVYRDFIQQAADRKKKIILWDSQRQYAGWFRSFDPSGDYVILTDVTIVQPDAVMTVSEVLLPLISLKIVSADQEGSITQAVSQPRPVSSVSVPPPVTAGVQVLSGESVTGPSELPNTTDLGLPPVPTDETVLPPIPGLSATGPTDAFFQQSDAAAALNQPHQTEAADSPVAPDPSFFEEKPVTSGSEDTLLPGISVSPGATAPEGEKPLRIPTLEELMGMPPAPAANSVTPPVKIPPSSQPSSPGPVSVEKSAPSGQPTAVSEEPEPVKTGLMAKFRTLGRQKKTPQTSGTTTPVVSVNQAEQAKKTAPFSAPPPLPQMSVQTGAVQSVRPSDFEVKGFEKPKPKIVPPEVLAQKSAEVSSSPFFQGYSPMPGQPQPPIEAVVPKKKRDVSTIILDVIIGFLVLVAVTIVVMGFLKIKMPFRLPFF